MLEIMAEFFEARLEGYDAHMLQSIQGAKEFYAFTAAQLPRKKQGHILDLGCGTGLELEHYFPLCPTAKVTGIDLSAKMLDALRAKFPEKNLKLICSSYFDIPFPKNVDAAVSVESLHHFTKEEKTSLYRKLHNALTDGGYFILTDYFATDDAEETSLRQEYLHLMQGVPEGCYHFDTPLTPAHEIQALREAGFSAVKILQNWGATYTIKAEK